MAAQVRAHLGNVFSHFLDFAPSCFTGIFSELQQLPAYLFPGRRRNQQPRANATANTDARRVLSLANANEGQYVGNMDQWDP